MIVNGNEVKFDVQDKPVGKGPRTENEGAYRKAERAGSFHEEDVYKRQMDSWRISFAFRTRNASVQ